MFPPASSEFIALCKSQVMLLTQGLGAAWSAVYLTQELQKDSPKLVPIAVYPEAEEHLQQDQGISGLVRSWEIQESNPRLLTETKDNFPQEGKSQLQEPLTWKNNSLHHQRQVVLPLIHEGIVFGVLVTRRQDRPWNQQELDQIQNIVTTLAIACMLDQRQAWYKEKFKEERHFRQLQQNKLDDLLHQLRNPLTALRTFSKLLLKRLLPGDRNQQVVQSLVSQSDRLRDLLQQLEDWNHYTQEEESLLTLNADSVKVPADAPASSPLFLLPGESLVLESLNIKDILEPLLITGETIAAEKGLHLRGDIPENLPSIQGNEKALREILSNLIDNALKYTPEGGEIQVTAGIERETSTGLFQGISIYNSGTGIPVEDREQIFERHYRGIQEQGEIEGTGLGLAIAKELTEKMQGEIELVVPETESGTQFIIWLPTIFDC